MKTSRILVVLVVGTGLPLLVSCAQQGGSGTANHAAAGASTAAGTAGAVGQTVKQVADRPIPNIPGKKLVSLTVDYAPGGRSISHHHADSAFIYAYVVSGEIRSQVNDEPVRVYKAGEYWFENPGSHHRVSENASATKPAKLLATFIVDADEQTLTTPAK
jgi:quercetin dioxygenase-like cupin family protein